MKTKLSFLWVPVMAFILIPCGGLYAQGIDTSNAVRLSIIIEPTNQATFFAPAELILTVSVDGPAQLVEWVDYFANTNLLSSVNRPFRPQPGRPWPFALPWSFVPVGEYSFTAVARPRSGESLATSAPVRISVESSCESGIVILPRISGDIRYSPELRSPPSANASGLDPLQSSYSKTTADNRHFRRGFAEFAIPVLPVRFSSGQLLLTMSPQGGDQHELSYYVADLTIDTNDFDRPTIPLTAFQRPPSQEVQTLVFDVTDLVAQFEGGKLGLRVKLAVDPEFNEIANLGAGFDPPRLVLDTCSNPPPRVNVWARDPIASERTRGQDPAAFVVWRKGSTNSALTIHYSVKGSAAKGSDYKALPGTVTIPAGSHFAQVSVKPVDDTLVERTEFLLLELELTPPVLDPGARISLPPPYLLGGYRQAIAFIFDNDRWRWQGKGR